MSLSKTWEIWVRSVNYINVSPQVVILYYSLAKNVTIVGNWAEYKRELSELFLATVCKSTITSIKISITNSSLILQSQKNPADRSQDTSPQSSLSVLSTTSPEPCFSAHTQSLLSCLQFGFSFISKHCPALLSVWKLKWQPIVLPLETHALSTSPWLSRVP